MVDYEPPLEPFRSAFWPTFAITGVAGTLGAAVVIAALHWPHVNPVALAAGLFAGVIAGAVFTYVAIICFPVYISVRGIRSYNLWGVYRMVTWAEMSGISRMNILGLRYIGIKSPGRGAIYVPLFLAGMQDFRSRVAAYAGPGSAIALGVS